MATTPKDTLRRIVGGRKSIFMDAKNQVDSTVSYNQGDQIALVGGKLKAMALAGDTATFLGIAPQTVSSGVPVGPYNGLATTPAVGALPGPIYGDIHEMKLKSGDSFTVGCKVYGAPTVDSQTVTVTSDGYPIGIYQGAAVTAGSSSLGEVLIGCQYALGNPVL